MDLTIVSLQPLPEFYNFSQMSINNFFDDFNSVYNLGFITASSNITMPKQLLQRIDQCSLTYSSYRVLSPLDAFTSRCILGIETSFKMFCCDGFTGYRHRGEKRQGGKNKTNGGRGNEHELQLLQTNRLPTKYHLSHQKKSISPAKCFDLNT